MAKANDLKLNVSESPGGQVVATVFGTLSEADGRGVFTVKHPYPGFDVEAGWVAQGRGVSLTFNGPREGQRIPCSRG